MGLIVCPDCGKRVSSAAPVCPSCGRVIAGVRPQSTSGMGAVLVVLSVLVGFVAAALANSLTYGNPIAIAVAFFVPIVLALVYASRRK